MKTLKAQNTQYVKAKAATAKLKETTKVEAAAIKAQDAHGGKNFKPDYTWAWEGTKGGVVGTAAANLWDPGNVKYAGIGAGVGAVTGGTTGVANWLVVPSVGALGAQALARAAGVKDKKKLRGIGLAGALLGLGGYTISANPSAAGTAGTAAMGTVTSAASAIKSGVAGWWSGASDSAASEVGTASGPKPIFPAATKLRDAGEEELRTLGVTETIETAQTDLKGLQDNLTTAEKELKALIKKTGAIDIKIVEKIALGKLNKFIGENTLLNQEWIMEPKKKVKDIIKEFAGKDKFEIKNFLRFKVGEGL